MLFSHQSHQLPCHLCEPHALRQGALHLLTLLRTWRPTAHRVVAWSAAASACANCSQWRWALEVLEAGCLAVGHRAFSWGLLDPETNSMQRWRDLVMEKANKASWNHSFHHVPHLEPLQKSSKLFQEPLDSPTSAPNFPPGSSCRRSPVVPPTRCRSTPRSVPVSVRVDGRRPCPPGLLWRCRSARRESERVSAGFFGFCT